MPEPVLVAIAAALAGKAATSLYDLVKRKFAGRSEAEQALADADGAPADSPHITALAEELAKAGEEDPDFADALRSTWHAVSQRADRGGVANQISGVADKAVQARDIQGGVQF
jgi:hypothetical protein